MKNMKVQVMINEEMVKKIDNYAKQMGVSRSALCSVFIGQGIMNYDRSLDLLTALGNQIGDAMITEQLKAETLSEYGKFLKK